MKRNKSYVVRPENFTLDPFHDLATGLVFAGLGNLQGSLHYHDSSPYGNHGTLTNMDPATDWVWDSTLNRLVIVVSDVASEYVDLGANQSLNIKSAISLGGWFVQTLSALSSRETYFASTATALGSGYWTGTSGDGTSAFYLDGVFDFSWSQTVTFNVLYHFCWTWDGSNMTAYVNGNQVAQATGKTGTITNWANTYISKNMSGDYAHNGLIGDPFIYNRALSLSEIAQWCDPSNVMLSGLILPPRRRLWAVSAAPPAANYWLWARQQTPQVIGGGNL